LVATRDVDKQHIWVSITSLMNTNLCTLSLNYRGVR